MNQKDLYGHPIYYDTQMTWTRRVQGVNWKNIQITNSELLKLIPFGGLDVLYF